MPAIVVAAWVLILFAYTFVASRLPVWLLLQPRDFINSHQLFVALGSIIAVTAGLAATRAEWLGNVYTDWAAASGGAAANFVNGIANLIAPLGISQELGQVFASVVVISFAATAMDTSVRLQRYIVSEIGEMYDVKPLREPTIATMIAVGACLLLAFGAHAPGGGVATGGLVIWPLFGTTNQLLAALSLVVIAVYLRKLGRPSWPVMVPMVFLTVMTTWAMLSNLGRWLLGEQPNYLLGILGLVVLGAAVWMVLEAARAFGRHTSAVAKEETG